MKSCGQEYSSVYRTYQILNQLKKDKISVDNARAKGEQKETMYETIIIDVVDIAYDACEKYILNREGVDKVKDIPFGAGYGMIEKEFDDRLRSIVQMGYSLILISHATFTSVGDDENAIQIASPTINKRGKKVCSRLVDNYIYISMEQTAEGLERVMHYRGTPYWEAGSRFRYMPESTPLGFKYYKEAMLEAIRKLEEEEGEEAVTDKRINNYALPQQKSREAVINHINEMINKHKPSSAISTARVNFLRHLLEYGSDANLGFEDNKFPPEKTIYLSLLRNTGIHTRIGREYLLGAPNIDSFMPLWNACEAFLESTKDKPRKLEELIKVLRTRHFKLKQGIIDLWIPAFLIIKKNDYSLYNDAGIYVPTLTREVLDLMQKSLAGYSIKAFNVEGVKLDLFNKYREALSLNQDPEFTADGMIETIKPFLIFYKKLNKYAQHTNRLQKSTVQFRKVLASAKDPEKTFFEDLPRALGFKDNDISNNAEVLQRYVELLQKAIRELRMCYSNLINRLEGILIDRLNLKSKEFSSYILELEQRYASIKTYLLTEKQKTFLTRVLAKNTDRVTWYQSISYVVLDKQLEALLDEEETYLVDNLIHSFKELMKYVDISDKGLTSEDNFFRLELVSNKGKTIQQIVQLSMTKVKQAETLENQINKLLSGDSDIDAYVLLNIINKRLNND